MSNSDESIVALQPNLFVFPSETDFRFALLVLAVIAAGTFIYDTLPGIPDLITVDSDYWWQFHIVSILLSIFLVLFLAFILYRLYPTLKIWRNHLISFGFDDSQEINSYLNDLCSKIELSDIPIFLWNPLDRSVNGVAFGHSRQYYVSFTGGLATKFYTDRDLFRTVILHELAHTKNGDIDKAYIAMAIWQVFLLLALIPFLLIVIPSLLYDNSFDTVLSWGWRWLSLVLLVFLSRNALLRTREVYADIRVSIWESKFVTVLKSLKFHGAISPSSLWEIVSNHPNFLTRYTAISDPSVFFKPNFMDTFITGVVAGVVIENLSYFLPYLSDSFTYLVVSETVAILVISPFVVGVFSLNLWFMKLVAVRRKTSQFAGLLGVYFGIGLIAGLMMSFASFEGVLVFFSFDINAVIFFMMFLITIFSYFYWLGECPSLWAEEVSTHLGYRRFNFIGLIVRCVIFTEVIGFLLMLSDILST